RRKPPGRMASTLTVIDTMTSSPTRKPRTSVAVHDDVAQWLAAREPSHLVRDQAPRPTEPFAHPTADMRRDENAGRRPQRVPFGQPLRLGHVQRRADAAGTQRREPLI